MLHAMLWNEIHALQSVPPPLPARATSACGYAPTRSTRAVARRPNERNVDAYRASARRAAWLGRRSKYSLLEYALRGARANTANGLVRASLLKF